MKDYKMNFSINNKNVTTDGEIHAMQDVMGLTFNFYADVTEISEELDRKIKEAIASEKKRLTPEEGATWTSEGAGGVEVEYICVGVDVGTDNHNRFIHYEIFGSFNDISGTPYEVSFSFPIDLHEYDDKVKQMVMAYVEDIIFGKSEPEKFNKKSQAA